MTPPWECPVLIADSGRKFTRLDTSFDQNRRPGWDSGQLEDSPILSRFILLFPGLEKELI